MIELTGPFLITMLGVFCMLGIVASIVIMLECSGPSYDELNDDLPAQDREFIKWVRSLKGCE